MDFMASSLTSVEKGMRFRSVYADSNALWEVKSQSGAGVWQCEIVDEPVEINGQTYSGDYAGVVKPFNSGDILASVRREHALSEMIEASDDWFDQRGLGETVHYANGHGQYVRCEVVIGTEENLGGLNPAENLGKKVLLPVALVGDWREHDLPRRDVDGTVRPGYHAGHILQGNGAWRPSTSCVYEAPDCAAHYKTVDPTQLEPLDLAVPEMTPAQIATAEKWQQVNAIRDAVSQGRDPDEILEAVSRELGSERPSL
jgi:hypothetical protein